MGDHNGAIAAAAITAVGGVIAALVGAGAFSSDDKGTDNPPSTSPQITVTMPSIPAMGNASVFVNRDSGPGGTQVLLSGEGFAPGERVTFRLHTEQIGRTTANGEGRFANVAVVIPKSFSAFAPQQFDIVANGDQSIRSARTPFTVTG